MSETSTPEPPPRRAALTWASRLAMLGGLAAAYGTLAGFMGRFLFPARPVPRRFLYVTEAESIAPGKSIVFRTPGGVAVNVARQGSGATAADFIALSSTCPHLGCQVHWEGHNDRFFCPCHNGVFDPSGRATAGPPAEAGQRLEAYALEVRRGLLFIELPDGELAGGAGHLEAPPAATGPGHDPCLAARTAGASEGRPA